jgi:hypothetical protein
MPSLKQIPAELLHPDKFLAFARWLCRNCHDARARVAFARKWSRLLNRPLTHYQYTALENGTPEDLI